MEQRDHPDRFFRGEIELGEGLYPGQVMHARKKGDRRYERLRARLMESEFALEVETQFGALDRLKPAGGRLPLGPYLQALWRRRHFIWRDVQSRVRTSNANERLGSLWLVLRPLLDAAFYGLIFSIVLRAAHGVNNYFAFIVVGIFMFQFTNSALTGAPGAIRQSKTLIRAFNFPRAAIPIALTLRQLLERLPAIMVMLVIIWAMPPHANPTWTWLWFIPVLALNTLFNLGLTFFLARVGHQVPDISNAMGFVTRILLYTSNILFPIDRLVDHPVTLAAIQANPLFQFIDTFRLILIHDTTPGPERWMALFAWGFGTLVLGFFFFGGREEAYGREQ